MKNPIRILLVVIVTCLHAFAAGTVPRDLLDPQSINAVRINLNPWGPHLGFEIELAGNDPRVGALVAMIREAELGGGHKCANVGAIRFRMSDGGMVGVGLLPSHEKDLYGLRLYDGDRYLATYRVERASLLAVLEPLGLPLNDPAFRE